MPPSALSVFRRNRTVSRSGSSPMVRREAWMRSANLGQPFRVFAGEVEQSADLVDFVLCGVAVLEAGAGP